MLTESDIGADEDPFLGLADAISNLMALFILFTMIVLTLQTSELVRSEGEGGLAGDDSGRYFAPETDSIVSAVTYVAVHNGGLAPLDWSRVGNAVLEAEGAGGAFVIEGLIVPAPTSSLPPTSSDVQLSSRVMANLGSGDRNGIDDFDVTLDLMPALKVTPAIQGAPSDVIAELEVLRSPGSTFSFIVYPDGFRHFVPVYELLQEKGTCFRWEAWPSDLAFQRQRSLDAGARRCPAS